MLAYTELRTQGSSFLRRRVTYPRTLRGQTLLNHQMFSVLYCCSNTIIVTKNIDVFLYSYVC